MTEPTPPPEQSPSPPSMADVAQEPAEDSVAAELEAVGDQPDVGGLVDDDHEQ